MKIQVIFESAVIEDSEGNRIADTNARVEGLYIKNCKFEFTHNGSSTSHLVIGGFRENITENEIYSAINFVNENLHLHTDWKYSSLFFSQMVILFAGGEILFNGQHNGIIRSGFDYRSVEMSLGENPVQGMKVDSKFGGAVLDGLSHRHVAPSSVWSIATNLINQHAHKNWFQKEVEKICNDGSEFITQEHIIAITDAAVSGALTQRSSENKITNEWIVFQENDVEKTILTLAVHEENDADIMNRIDSGQIVFG